MFFYWVLTPCSSYVDTNISEEHTVYIFNPEERYSGRAGSNPIGNEGVIEEKR
jgi:hypothetical protein